MGELAERQAALQLPLTLALPESVVTQALPPDVPATLVGVGEGVAVGVGVGVAVAAPVQEPPSIRATFVARTATWFLRAGISATCLLRAGISATCVSSAISLPITSLDAAEVAVGVGVAVVRGAEVAVGVGVAVARGADVAVGVGVAVARGLDVAVGVGVAVAAAQIGNPIRRISSLPKGTRRDRGIHPVS